MTEETVARAASAYMREHKAFDAMSSSFRDGKKVPTVSQLLDGHPPYRDSMTADIETYVARSRQIAGLPDALRDDLKDVGTWPTRDGAVRVFDAVAAIDTGDIDEAGIGAVGHRAAWYGAIMGVPRLRRELFSPYRDTDQRRMAYRFGLEFSGNLLGHVAQWRARYQEDVSAEGHLILHRIGAMVELVDWMREHHHEVERSTKGKMQREQLFSLAAPSPTAAAPANPHPAFPTEAEHLQNDAARIVRAERLAAEGQTGFDESGNVVDDDVRRAAEALGTKTIDELLGHPKMPVIPKLEVAGTSDQKSFMGQFAQLALLRVPLVVAPDVGAVSRNLVEMWPHAVDVIHRILTDVRQGEPVRPRPTLLVSDPGSGKTRLLKAVASLLGTPSAVFPCASVADGSFGGTPAQWSTRRASVPLELIRSNKIANPVIVLDELEKTGTSSHNGSLLHAILPMLERHTASAYFETALETNVDLSAVSFLATANDLSKLPDPLRDRFRVIHMPNPSLEHLEALVDGIVLDVLDERGVPEKFFEPLAPDEIEVVGKAWGGGSLRKLRVVVKAALDHRDAMAVR